MPLMVHQENSDSSFSKLIHIGKLEAYLGPCQTDISR